MSDYFSLSLPVADLDEHSENPFLVLPESPLLYRQWTEDFARYFKREMHFDFPQFEAAETAASLGFVPYEAHLFHEPADDHWTADSPKRPLRFVGACCFRRDDEQPKPWRLDWAWLHPFSRRRGHLVKAWPYFTSRYGSFELASPVSCCMGRFLRRVAEGSVGE